MMFSDDFFEHKNLPFGQQRTGHNRQIRDKVLLKNYKLYLVNIKLNINKKNWIKALNDL